MKKLLVILLSAMMVLSMIPAMALTASAAGEGMWTTRRNIGDDDAEEYTPCAGYQYTNEGFQTISPDFTNCGPFYTIVTKEAQNLKDGFSMKFRIDEFDYKGEDGTADEWITLSLWEADSCVPGNTQHGSGWLCLIRGTGAGSAAVQSFWTEASNPEAGIPGGFNHKGDVSISCELDADEKELYDFTVENNGGAYSIKVNGVEVAGMSSISDSMNALKPDGDFFVGITFHTSAPGGNASLTILETNGAKPTGNDKKDPEENLKVPGPKIEKDSIPANTPAALFNAQKLTFNKDPEGQNCLLSAKGDNTYHVTATTGAAFFFQWGIKASINLEAQDFPIVSMLVRNWNGSDSGTIYYSAGEVMGPGDSNHDSWMLDWDHEWEIGDDIYDLIIWDGTDYDNFVGQIHNFRFDMVGITNDEEDGFDVCYIGCFKSEADAIGYAESEVKRLGGVEDLPTEAPTDAPTEKPTEAATTAEDVTEVATTASGETTANTTAATEANTEADKGGCASVIGGSVALILTAIAAAVALKKKN